MKRYKKIYKTKCLKCGDELSATFFTPTEDFEAMEDMFDGLHFKEGGALCEAKHKVISVSISEEPFV